MPRHSYQTWCGRVPEGRQKRCVTDTPEKSDKSIETGQCECLPMAFSPKVEFLPAGIDSIHEMGARGPAPSLSQTPPNPSYSGEPP